MARKSKVNKQVGSFTHGDASRKNIPTAEYQAVMERDDRSPVRVAYQRRNRDLDPQLVWRGKDEQDASDLLVQAPPLFIQEKSPPQSAGRRPGTPQQGNGNIFSTRPLCRFQWAAGRRRTYRVLPARRQLVQSYDPRRRFAGDGLPRRARRITW